jgi:hypothetical protein
MHTSHLLQRAGCLLVLTACIACDRQISPSSASYPPAQANSDLSKKIEALEAQVWLLENRMNSVETDSSAMINTEEDLYGIVRTRHGTFTISTKSMTPFLDGFKVGFQVGNLTSADFEGANMSVAWGSGFGNKKQFKLVDRFRAGTFTDVEVALTPAKAEDVKKLLTGISVDKLVLRR